MDASRLIFASILLFACIPSWAPIIIPLMWASFIELK
jgi:hypothetical protein